MNLINFMKLFNMKSVYCSSILFVTLFLLWSAYFVLSFSFNKHGHVEESDDGMSGTIKYSPPDLSDEEANSPFMPSQLRCDACRAIAFQLYESYRKFNEQNKRFKYDLPESEILDLTEETCDYSTFEKYGFLQVKKVKRLKGPGLDTEDTPGVMQGGGRWPGRLQEMCRIYVSDLEDVEIYKAYKKKYRNRQHFEDYLCRGDGLRGYCSGFESKEKPPRKQDEL